MRYFKLVTLLLLIFVVFAGCPKKQEVKPAEEIVIEEVPYEEVKIPEEFPIEPEKPELVLDRIFFDFDKSDIRVDASETLKRNADMLKLYPSVKVIIEGHCCEIGTAEYNLALGERRAAAARDYLVMLGINPDRLATVSYGEEKPLDPTDLPRNRRCEFLIR